MSTNERTPEKARIDIGSLLDALDALDSGDEASVSSPLSYRSNGHDGLTDIDSDRELFEAERSEEVEAVEAVEAERSEEVEAVEAVEAERSPCAAPSSSLRSPSSLRSASSADDGDCHGGPDDREGLRERDRHGARPRTELEGNGHRDVSGR